MELSLNWASWSTSKCFAIASAEVLFLKNEPPLAAANEGKLGSRR